ncbi:MAG TPA: protein translocase subunit SecF [Pyrinomonadaceae bacterium]|nr:protein translocase subunit SecF [Pyrinomonadaceae bacterium]
MIRIFDDINVDWLGKRRLLLSISIVLMLVGLGSAIIREAVPGGTRAFNQGVDFLGGTVVNVRFNKRPSDDTIRAALTRAGLADAVLQPVLDRNDEVMIKVGRQGSEETAQAEAQVDIGRTKIAEALASLGPETGARIEKTEAVGAVAGSQLRNQAITVTLLALVGIMLYIGLRYEWTYGAAAVITVFHDVLVTLGFFSIFQWEVNLTVIAALLTLVGFSVNDTIVTFDRVRENLRLHRRRSLYDITNEAINQTLSRTIITSGLVFLSVLALVLFGGEVLRGFSLALLIGIVFGTYSTIVISNPIMVWWQQRLEPARTPTKTGDAASRRTPAAERKAKAGAAAR